MLCSSPLMCTCSSEGADYGGGDGCDSGCDPRGRRLLSSSSTKMDMDELVLFIQTLEAGGWTFPGMIYQARGIDFHSVLKETRFRPVVPIIQWLSAPLVPFYHHQLLFPLGVNGTLLSPVQEALGWWRVKHNPSYLTIHMTREGIEGRLRSSVSKGYDFQYMGNIRPSWILGTLVTMGKTDFSFLSWHCQHVGVRLFEDVARECTAEQMAKCPPTDVNAVFPKEILPWLCLLCQKLAMLGLVLGTATLAYKLLNNLKERGAKRDATEMLVGM